MKFVTTILMTLLIAGCNYSQDTASVNASASQTSSSARTVEIDVSTPDRALKSYWQAKDTSRKVEFDWSAAQISELQKLKSKLGFDLNKIMASDVLSAHQEMAGLGRFEEYSREIVDIKQDTDSRATAVVIVRNTTPIPAGVMISDSDKEEREKGERFKYVLEKDADGWKVAQVYIFNEFLASGNQEPWMKVFSVPTKRASVYVLKLEN